MSAFGDAEMEGAHRGGHMLKDVVVGSSDTAAVHRRHAQKGAAAAARRGQAVQVARAQNAKAKSKASAEEVAISREVDRSLKKGTSLVQAAIEHLETAERLWDKFVEEYTFAYA